MTTGRRTSHRRLVSNLYPSVFVGGTWTVVLLVTLAVHTSVYLTLVLAPVGADTVQQAGLGYGPFRPWQLLSYLFAFETASPVSFLFTMAIFLMVAGDVSVVMGWRRFLLYYLTCGVVAGFGTWLWVQAATQLLPGVRPMGVTGPTGAVCGLIFAFSHYFGRRRIYGIIPARVYCGLLTMVLVGGTMILVTLQHGRGTGTPYLGQLTALVGAMIYFQLEPRIRHWRLVRQTFSELEQIQQQAILEESVDSILAKVKAEGADSLSPTEKRCLRRASRVIARRKRERS